MHCSLPHNYTHPKTAPLHFNRFNTKSGFLGCFLFRETHDSKVQNSRARTCQQTKIESIQKVGETHHRYVTSIGCFHSEFNPAMFGTLQSQFGFAKQPLGHWFNAPVLLFKQPHFHTSNSQPFGSCCTSYVHPLEVPKLETQLREAEVRLNGLGWNLNFRHF